MKKRLIAFSVVALSASAVAVPTWVALSDRSVDVLPVLGGQQDPRLVGLRSGPGAVPAGSEIEQLARNDDLFAAGMALFDRAFHKSKGLGTPEMNADSCRGCHQDPVIGGAGGLDVNVFRFGRDQMGTAPFEDLPGGQAGSKLRRVDIPGRENTHPDADVFEQRQTPTALGLGFIGLGAQPPVPEWGAMISTGRQFLLDQWWVPTIPGIAILVVSMGFNVLGDGMRDVLDPRSGGPK